LDQRSKKKAKCPPFTAITHDVLFHQGFLSLTTSGKVLYLIMASKVKAPLGKGRYDYEFSLSYTEISKWGISAPATISKGIKELKDKGLIEIVKAGGLKSCGGITTKYKLSERYKNI